MIALQGNKQAALIENKIRERISESEFVKKNNLWKCIQPSRGRKRYCILINGCCGEQTICSDDKERPTTNI